MKLGRYDVAYKLCQVQAVFMLAGDLCCLLLEKRVRVWTVMVYVAQNGNCWHSN
jgi:hypothetical protein